MHGDVSGEAGDVKLSFPDLQAIGAERKQGRRGYLSNRTRRIETNFVPVTMNEKQKSNRS